MTVKMGKGKNEYWFDDKQRIGYGKTGTGEVFIFDQEDFCKIKDTTWYRCNVRIKHGVYVGNSDGICIHRFLVSAPEGYEIDHINLNPLDNRKVNLRVCTHQQNQCNRDLQKNNTSGVTGVSFYKPRNKYRARIKYFQRELHLGYYDNFTNAVQARNEGMALLFGEFGRYNDVPPAPPHIKRKVREKCSYFLKEVAAFNLSTGAD